MDPNAVRAESTDPPPPEAQPDRLAAARSAAVAAALGLYALVGGLISLIGWVADASRLTDWDSDGISIQPNATLAAAAAGASIILLVRGYKKTAAILGILVGGIGATALLQYLSGINLGIDTLLMFEREWGRRGVLFPGRMGPPGAVSWTVIGCALVMASSTSRGDDKPWRAVAPALALITVGISSLSIVGYLYGASALYTIPTATVIAFQTSTFILAVSVGVVLAIPGHGPMRLLSESGPAGVLVRRILPSLIVLPIALGLLKLTGERAGLYDLAFGTAAMTVLEIGLLLGLLWWTASAISRQSRARERTEKEVRASQSRLTETLESIGDGFVALDRDWRYMYVNPEAGRLLKKAPGEMRGRIAWEVFPEAVGSVADLELHRAAAERTSVEFEDFDPRLERWFSNKAYPAADGGLTIYFQDVTTRKAAEDELRESRMQLEADLADNIVLQRVSAEIIHENDVQSLFETIVDSAISMTRAQFGSLQLLETDPDSGTAIGLRLIVARGFNERAAQFWELVTPNSRSTCGQSLTRGERIIVPDILTCEFMAGTEDLDVYRETGIGAVQSTPLVSRGGKLLGMLSTHWNQPYDPSMRELRLLDILARQAADLIERRHNEEALRTADRRKDEFLMTLAHELRNPLAPVRTAVDLIKKKPSTDPDITRAREVIDRQTTLMTRLLDDLMDVGRIAHDRLVLRQQRVELGSLIRGAIETSGPLLERSKHELHLSVPTEPIYLHADPLRLGQVIGNLLNNACRYSEPNGHIWVEANQHGLEAVITIRDAGMGIPQSKLTSIFDLFSQVDSSLERSQGGLGIGLHLARRLVHMHGGRIDVESDGPGAGSTFTLRLPVTQTLDVVVAEGTEPHDSAQAASPLRVLVVDDNVDAADMLTTLLQWNGHHTHSAHDGPGALTAAESYRPDVILLDIGLPQLNGFDVCRQIREQTWGRDIVLVALTGWGQESDRSLSRDAGFDHHVVKPVEHDALLRLLASIPARSAAS